MRMQKKYIFAILAFLLGFGVLYALHTGGRLIILGWLLKTAWILPLFAGAIWIVLKHRSFKISQRRIPLFVLLLLMGLYLFSSSALNPVFYYLNWPPTVPWELGKGWLERTLLLTAVLVPVILIAGKRYKYFLLAALAVCQLSAFAALWKATGGEPLYRVDHPAFFFRLWSFGQSMPRFIYYDPFWNGGKVMPYLSASGILSPGFFLWPVWKYLETHLAYTPAFGFLFLFVVPALAALSARIMSRSREMAVTAAFLSLGTCHFYFIHLVHYGTIGSLFATAFLMPLSASLYQIVIKNKTGLPILAVLFISGFFLLCWPPAALMAIPMAITILFNAKSLTRRSFISLAVFAVVMFFAFLLPLLSLLTHSDVQSFARTTNSLFSQEAFVSGWLVLADLLRQTHPVILFLGIAGSFFLPSKGMRRWFVPILLASMIIAGWGREWKTDLQLDRMFINALFIAILPAAWAASTFLRSKTVYAVLASALISALLIMGGYNTVKYMGNEGRAKFRTMSPEIKQMVSWIKNNTPDNGRIMFAGAAVHGYSAAKIAALPVYTEREMMSCDYYGFSPKLVEYNYPTREFRKHGRERLSLFMDLYNITHVVTYHEDWKGVFRKHNDQYEEMISFGKKTIFKVKRRNSMFIKGSGSVKAGINSINVKLNDSAKPAVIKYNWVDGLTSSDDCVTLSPYETGTSVKLIAIEPNGAEKMTISYDRWF